MGDSDPAVTAKTFRVLVESADRKFARVRDLPVHGPRGIHHHHHYFQKVFKAYTRLWKFQQENRSRLVQAGLNRWEIGEIASRIGQLYYSQYLRTSEVRFLLESYIFYEAILNRGYFEGGGSGKPKDLGLRYKELRFFARFFVVSLLLNRTETVRALVDRFRALVDDCRATFPDTNFKEWKQVAQETVRFLKADAAFTNIRPLRYSVLFDSHQASLPYVARFHAKRVLKLKDAVLTSYHRNEIKFTELTLDAFRMLQCLEWEPSGSFYQMRTKELSNNGACADQSGLIDINLAADMTDPTLPPNPHKAILYHPSVPHLISVIATICDELPPESIMLIYISASGKFGRNISHLDSASNKLSNMSVSQTCHESDSSLSQLHVSDKGGSTDFFGSSLFLGSRGSGDLNHFYPGDLIPFTRRPLFLIIDSDNSHAFKVLHGAERGEKAALLLSPRKPTFRNPSAVDGTQQGNQFTFFLTAPLQAFCQLVGLVTADTDMNMQDEAENILSSTFSEWEVILCTSRNLDLVWAQVLSDPFLRRLILRFIFYQSILSLFHWPEKGDQYLPECLPHLPDSVSPHSTSVESNVLRLARCLRVDGYFHFTDDIKAVDEND